MGAVDERHGGQRARCPSAARSSCSATTCARAVRLAALSGYKVAFVWSHDSVGVGEDGPTHQPIEQLASLRAMPGLRLIRPADANEVAQAWRVHIDGDGPTAIILTRQKVPVLEGTAERAPDGVPRGAYTLVDEDATGLDLVLIGTGSEVQLCVAARETLAARRRLACGSCRCRRGTCSRRSPTTYRDAVLPARRARRSRSRPASASAGSATPTTSSRIDRFGASAPGDW